MIIVGMSIDEIQKQVGADFLLLNKVEDSRADIIHDWAVRKKNESVLSWQWKSPNGNIWHMMYQRDGEHVNIVHYMFINGNYGRYVLKPQPTDDGFVILVYLPHFFKRYRERMKLGNKLNPGQLIRRYLRRNSNASCRMNDIGEFEATTAEGIGLGVAVSERQRLMKTFITYDMAKGSQIERFREGNKRRKQMCDNYPVFSVDVRNEMMEFGLTDEELNNKKQD